MKTTLGLLVLALAGLSAEAKDLTADLTIAWGKWNAEYTRLVAQQIDAENKRGIYRLKGTLVEKVPEGLVVESGKSSRLLADYFSPVTLRLRRPAARSKRASEKPVRTSSLTAKGLPRRVRLPVTYPKPPPDLDFLRRKGCK
jgi:hypothetical protein